MFEFHLQLQDEEDNADLYARFRNFLEVLKTHKKTGTLIMPNGGRFTVIPCG